VRDRSEQFLGLYEMLGALMSEISKTRKASPEKGNPEQGIIEKP